MCFQSDELSAVWCHVLLWQQFEINVVRCQFELILIWRCNCTLWQQFNINVVRWRSSAFIGTLWYPFQASIVVRNVCGGASAAIWNGLSPACVCLTACLLRGCRSITLLGFPLFLVCMHILLHQVEGVLGGTSSNTPSLTSLLISASTCSLKCIGTWPGLWHAMGLAAGSINSSNAGVGSNSLLRQAHFPESRPWRALESFIVKT